MKPRRQRKIERNADIKAKRHPKPAGGLSGKQVTNRTNVHRGESATARKRRVNG